MNQTRRTRTLAGPALVAALLVLSIGGPRSSRVTTAPLPAAAAALSSSSRIGPTGVGPIVFGTTPEQAAELGRLGKRTADAATWVALLVGIALVAMAIAVTGFIIFTVAIRKEYQHSRVYDLLLQAFRRLASSYRSAETTWLSPDNLPALRAAESLGMVPDKHFAIYEKPLGN